jgi:cation-transporting P-type ATPase E
MLSVTDLPGLTSAEVAERVARGEINDVPAAPTRTVKQIIRSNVLTRFNALLGGMLVIVLIVGPLQDALFGVVLVANSLIGIVQEVRAKRTLDRLTLLTSPRASVIRDGATNEVTLGEVVMDDLLVLGPGDQIVVDGLVLEAPSLEVDESLLTGEADPVEKHPGDEVLSGSFVVAGTGAFRATKVGRESYAARLAADARRFSLSRSELRDGIDTILAWVTVAIVPTGVLLFWSQLRARDGWREAMSGAVAGTVAMVPEGLVLLTSLAFGVAVVRLARRRVLVQELPAVEGLARVDVLCIDKTGTLTEGNLAVERVEILDPTLPVEEALAALGAADQRPNATMRAIAERYASPPGWTATGGVPFSSARTWSGAAFGDHGAWIAGAPETVAAAASISAKTGREIVGEAELGKRVVMLAHGDVLGGGDRLPEGLVAAAYVVIADSVRADAADTLRYFERQDVAVKVISGDHPRTVAAIAGRLGLAGAGDAVDARDLPTDREVLGAFVEARSVFGRVSPQQKREMVGALQARGHTVAMTGDGVNDALALKDADIGVAMGEGSAATRAVAQLVLLDSSFAALPPVVAEGRRVLGNIERTSGLYLTKTAYSMLLALAVGVAGFVFPFLPRHLTLIGALTIGVPSFFLALAPNEDRFRAGFIRRVTRFALPAGMLAAIATFLAYALARDEVGVSLIQAQTTAVMVLTWVGLLVLSILAAPMSGWRLALVWAMAGVFTAMLQLPVTKKFFALEPPNLLTWLAGFGIAALVWSFARLFIPEERPEGPGGHAPRRSG